MTSNINPSKLIIDYYDSLINKIDIYTEQVLEAQSASELVFNDPYFNPPQSQLTSQNVTIQNKIKQFCEIETLYSGKSNITLNNEVKTDLELSTVHYYVNKMREEMINELNRLKDETMTNYQRLKQSGQKLNYEDESTILSVLFAQKFPFLVYQNSLANKDFKIFLVVLDFYISFDAQSCLR